jgi:hypothetical protein
MCWQPGTTSSPDLDQLEDLAQSQEEESRGYQLKIFRSKKAFY